MAITRIEDYPRVTTAGIGWQLANGPVWFANPKNAAGWVNPAIMLSTLPTADPHIAGALWNNAGVPTVSAG